MSQSIIDNLAEYYRQSFFSDVKIGRVGMADVKKTFAVKLPLRIRAKAVPYRSPRQADLCATLSKNSDVYTDVYKLSAEVVDSLLSKDYKVDR